MKTKKDIQNIEDLREEIRQLKLLKFEQEAYLNDQFTLLGKQLEAPIRIYQKITSFLPTAKEAIIPEKKPAGADWVTSSFRIGLPFLFNKVLFKKAGFLKRGLLLLASQQAANLVNKERLVELVNKTTDFVQSLTKDKKKKKHTDYGIPPDSETY